MKKLGRVLGLGVLLMIGLSFLTVVLNNLFNIVIIPIQELIIYIHSSVFMLGIVYCHHYNKHVRIDIFYQNFNQKKQNKINSIGTLILLIPVFIFMFYISFDYVLSSWSKLEGSGESGGLPFVYGHKTLLLILPLTMLVYSIYKLVRKS